jgi:RNA polymerase-binding transcription factor DksA
MTMTDEVAFDHRVALEDERDRLLSQRASLAAEVTSILAQGIGCWSTPDEACDSASEQVELDRLAALISALDARLGMVDDALTSARYGLCSSCHEPIAQERMRALPGTAHCISCARTRC